jgi:hypothetical protein
MTMSEEIEQAPNRFEWLAGRFFDGELSEAEDREFVALLEADAALGRRFLEMARLDCAISALVSSHRVSDAAFEAAVRKGLEFQRDDESHRFAQHVVALVREGSERRRTRRLSLTHHERRPAPQFAAYAIAAVACITLAVLVFLFATRAGTPVASGARSNTATSTAVAAAPESGSPLPPRLTPPIAENPQPRGVALKKAAPEQPVTPEINVAQNAAENPDAPLPLPIPEAAQPEQSPSSVAAAPAHGNGEQLATVEKLTQVTATIQHNGAQQTAVVSSRCLEGDVLRIAAIDASPGEESPHNTAFSGAEVALADGSKLLLTAGAELRFHVENQSACPTLNAGELFAHIMPQQPGHPLRIRTQQGPVVEVVGTVFRLAAETAHKRVSLRVDEGKVLFTSQNVERKVSVGEMCDAEDGHAPGQVVRVRPAPGMLSGVVVDKATGKPLENAQITAVPQAHRKNDRTFTVKSDAQGKFKFDALRDGNYFVVSQPDGNVAVPRFATTRARVQPGEDSVVSLAVDKAAVVVCAVEDSSKHLLVTNYRVRFTAEGSDGMAVHPIIQVEGQTQLQHDAEVHCAVIEGAGKYLPAVDKPGLLIKVRTPQRVQLSTDRINQWPLDVQVSASAAIKGRVLDAGSSAVLADDPALDPNDPHAPRTVLTLTQSNGYVHALCAESDGSFLFNTNLDAGTYELKAVRFGYSAYTHRITLTAGQALESDVTLEPVRTKSK